MASNRAIERASYIIEMSEADERQRNIKPLPETPMEARIRENKARAKHERDTYWREVTLPGLKKEWEAARRDKEDDPIFHVLTIRNAIESRLDHPKLVFPYDDHTKRTPNWTEIFTQFRSILTERFTRLTSAARGVLPHGHSATVN